jgi:outer membrane lipoprotein SlyB
MFKKTIITTTALLVLATPAFAETVRDHYKTVIEQTPYSVEVCKDVQIRGQASTGDTVFGALLGGVIGNQFGGGKGKDAATILGAIVGADVANKNTKSASVKSIATVQLHLVLKAKSIQLSSKRTKRIRKRG